MHILEVVFVRKQPKLPHRALSVQNRPLLMVIKYSFTVTLVKH